MTKKVFVSYDHSEDFLYKELLRAWDANTSFDFRFDLRSPNQAIDSVYAPAIQASLTRKMKESDFILVIVGEKTHTSKWMRWEIKRAQQDDTNLRFAAVKIKSQNLLPAGLPEYTAIANGFTLEAIKKALTTSNRNY